MGAVDSAAHRARRTNSAQAVTRQVSARITSDGGWIPRPVARTSSPRVHGSGAVVCRTRARLDRAHRGYVGRARGRTSSSIAPSRAPSLRSERAVAPANPGELCSFTASRAPDQPALLGIYQLNRREILRREILPLDGPILRQLWCAAPSRPLSGRLCVGWRLSVRLTRRRLARLVPVGKLLPSAATRRGRWPARMQCHVDAPRRRR